MHTLIAIALLCVLLPFLSTMASATEICIAAKEEAIKANIDEWSTRRVVDLRVKGGERKCATTSQNTAATVTIFHENDTQDVVFTGSRDTRYCEYHPRSGKLEVAASAEYCRTNTLTICTVSCDPTSNVGLKASATLQTISRPVAEGEYHKALQQAHRVRQYCTLAINEIQEKMSAALRSEKFTDEMRKQTFQKGYAAVEAIEQARKELSQEISLVSAFTLSKMLEDAQRLHGVGEKQLAGLEKKIESMLRDSGLAEEMQYAAADAIVERDAKANLDLTPLSTTAGWVESTCKEVRARM